MKRTVCDICGSVIPDSISFSTKEDESSGVRIEYSVGRTKRDLPLGDVCLSCRGFILGTFDDTLTTIKEWILANKENKTEQGEK